MTQRYRYSASLLSNKNRRKNNKLQSGYSGEFLLLFPKSNVFAPLTPLRGVQRKTLLPRAMGCTPFLAHHGPKNSLRFSAHFCGLEKIGANNAPKKLPTAIFSRPSFANKIISAAPKLSAKKWSLPFARTNVQFVREPRRQKRESLQLPLSAI